MWKTINQSTFGTMRNYSVKEWEERFDELFFLVENGETIGIYDEENGNSGVLMPYEDYENLRYLSDHDDAS